MRVWCGTGSVRPLGTTRLRRVSSKARRDRSTTQTEECGTRGCTFHLTLRDRFKADQNRQTGHHASADPVDFHGCGLRPSGTGQSRPTRLSLERVTHDGSVSVAAHALRDEQSAREGEITVPLVHTRALRIETQSMDSNSGNAASGSASKTDKKSKKNYEDGDTKKKFPHLLL
ncbi:unnamed protein product [Boreogadus saida]